MTDKPIDPQQPPETLLTFPCDFPLKVFGLGTEEFESTVLMIIRKHVPSFSDTALQVKPSEKGKYRSLSINLHIDSKQQLDALYQDLSSSPQVIMVL